MPMYLTRFSYTPATWAKLVEHPDWRLEPPPAGVVPASRCRAASSELTTVAGGVRVVPARFPRCPDLSCSGDYASTARHVGYLHRRRIPGPLG